MVQVLRSIACCGLAFAVLALPAPVSGQSGAPYAEFPVLRGPWLGQPPPGERAEIFAPGILKPPGGFHSSVVFSPAGDEACWTEMASGVTYLSRLVGGVWARPEALPWDPEYGVREPFYSHDGRRVYFLSRRPPAGERVERERIWLVDRDGPGWGTPRPVGRPISDHPTHWQFSLSRIGNLYFTSEAKGVRGGQDIYLALRSGDGFATPRDVGGSVNSDVRDFCPFVAPDESYLVFARAVPEQRGRSDLFVSFRTRDGGWTPTRNLGDAVNTPHNEVSPAVTPDGRFLVFLRVSSEINEACWVAASVIDRLGPG